MTCVVAVIGASGSGKTRLVKTLVSSSARFTVLRVDDYYRVLDHLDFASRDRVNFDHPDAIEFERLAVDLTALRAGKAIAAPIYDFSRHTRASATRTVNSADIIVLEGVLAMADLATRALVDYLVFVNSSLDICLARRVARDATERGRSEASVIDFWESRAVPMFEQFVAPWREEADLVVSGERNSASEAAAINTWLATLPRSRGTPEN
ncbi:MAG TPA: uridine kinase [Halieaceae bacterium]|nr:uridine kinase [Halieaceae bacterium]HCJ39428.1 uridine kinase [Halieaceae bacterium]|tara:strand:+ start:1618 stop:2244 length:627 start_codon:yes stop_codon:yes gene_type:complete